MATVSMAERQNISLLHGVPPANHRDASGPWKHNPTPISVSDRTAPLQHQRSTGRTPWARTSMQGNPRGGGIGNQTANSTITGAKRRKIESQYFVSGRGPRQRPIIASDDDEDLGTLISPDDLDIMSLDSPFPPPRAGSTLPRAQTKHHPPDLGGAIPSFTASKKNSGSRIPKDGPATRKLQKDLDTQDAESDPIACFSDEPEPASRQSFSELPRSGVVKKNISKFEGQGVAQNTEGSAGPRIDLRTHQRGTIKNKMKLKTQAPAITQRDEFGTASSFLSSSRSTAQHVRVKEWYLGIEHKHSDAGYAIAWTKSTMTFKQERSPPLLELDIACEISSISYFNMTSGTRITDVPIIVMETYPPRNNRRQRDNEHFKMGAKHALGKITVKFDTSRDDWSKSYLAFMDWIKSNVEEKHSLSAAGARSAWETAERSGELGMISAKRRQRENSVEEVQPDDQRRSLKRPAPDVESLRSFTPPPAEELANGALDRHSTSRSDSRTATRPSSSRNSNPVPSIVPRRSSRQTTRQKEVSPEADPDEVVLCYPQGVPGAVSITNADFCRLQPGEFLNDTLIEFGLKLWLRRLEESNPEVANQVHVFSSFFYKKLHKKDINEGYQSVRKWTSRLDIFSKKFLIVPINENFHWYLAVVYQPEFILLPPPSPPPPKETRQRAHRAGMTEASAPEQLLFDNGPPSPPLREEASAAQEISSEDAVERDLCQFEASCSVTAPSEHSPVTLALSDADNQDPPEHPFSPFPEMEVDYDIQHRMTARALSPTVSDYTRKLGSSNHSTRDVNMIEISSSSSRQEENDISSLFGSDDDVEHALRSTAVAPTTFYGSNKAKGKQKAMPQPEPLPMEVDDDDGAELTITSTPSKLSTYIFTMDSLGGKHPAAIKRLQRYLRLEAEDKRKVLKTSEALGKQAIVPVQPNFCDCGLFLLHFAETFVNDPAKYCRIITSTTTKTANDARREDWDGAKTVGMREMMMEEITNLSIVWKKERAEKEEARKIEEAGPVEVVDSSDGEVDIVDVTPAIPEKGKGKGIRKGKNSPVKGKAARLRSG